ncbi:holin [Rhodococcus xishaensis]|uniref:Holin n=1 Tax=Rhodococcus xishaensis TaxID=2487364 RepID=A0A438AWD2_9NOCA|nr:holin [Rhodococcus xishaensis]RVW02998.1 holin [Rhodococcus xishaensis]
MWTITFWSDAAERAIKTAVQAFAALLVVGTTVLDLDWGNALAVVGTAALASLLSSLASGGVGDRETASLLRRG